MLRSIFIALLTAIGAVAPATAATPSSSTSTPVLRASGTNGQGASVSVRLALQIPSLSSFERVRSTSNTLTLGYPKTRTVRSHTGKRYRLGPCATTTFKLSIVAGDDPLALVRQQLPTAQTEAAIRSSSDAAGVSATSPISGAWRSFSTIERSFYLHYEGRATHVLPGSTDAIRVLTMTARTTHVRLPCSSASTLTNGPNLLSTVTAAATA